MNLNKSTKVNSRYFQSLAAAAGNSAETFHEQTDLTIVLVEDKVYPLKPENTLNIAISVTGVAVLLIMIVALLVMQHKCGYVLHVKNKS